MEKEEVIFYTGKICVDTNQFKLGTLNIQRRHRHDAQLLTRLICSIQHIYIKGIMIHCITCTSLDVLFCMVITFYDDDGHSATVEAAAGRDEKNYDI